MTPKHVHNCPTCGASTKNAQFDKTTEWPLYMGGKSFVQENIDPQKKTWKFDTYVCSNPDCKSQFMDVVSK